MAFQFLPSENNLHKKESVYCDKIQRDIEKNDVLMKNFLLIESFHGQVDNVLKNESNLMNSIFGDVKGKVQEFIKSKKSKSKDKQAAVEFSYLKRYCKRTIFSKIKRHPMIYVSRNGTQAESKRYGWKSIFTNQLLTEGDYYLEVELTKYRKRQLSQMGLVNPTDYYKNYGNSFDHEIGNIGFCLDLSSGDKLYKGKRRKYMKPFPRTGDVIGVCVNFNSREIYFTLNKTKFGVAFCSKKVKPPLCLVISSFLSNQKFTLLDPNPL